jgi:hypothetical protein
LEDDEAVGVDCEWCIRFLFDVFSLLVCSNCCLSLTLLTRKFLVLQLLEFL